MLARVAWYYQVANRNRNLNSSDLEEFRDKRVAKIVSHVFKNVPYYRDLMKLKGLTPQDFRTTRDLIRLPVLSRDEIQQNYPSKIVSSDRGWIVQKTTGTTGDPLEVRWDSRYADIVTGLCLRRVGSQGISLLRKGALISYYGSDASNHANRESTARNVFKILFGTATGEFPVLRLRTFGLGSDNVTRIAKQLIDYGPYAIRSRPSYLWKLATFVNEEKPGFAIEKIVSGGECLSDGIRKELAELYHAEVLESYGCQEVGPLGYECREHSGIHLNSDFFAFEFVAKDGEPASEGESAEILLSCLDNRVMPLIRYQLGDRVVLEKDEKCACGSSLIRLRKIEGRTIDGLCNSDGEIIAPGETVEYLQSVLGLREFQIIQKNSNEIVVMLRLSDNTPSKKLGLREYFNRVLGERVGMEFATWDESKIPIKYRPVINESRQEIVKFSGRQ